MAAKRATKRAGLGRGLSALMEEMGASTSSSAVTSLPLAEITPNPDQPRRNFDNTSLQELADSIRLRGVLQPILVRKVKDQFQIVAGERRWRACQLANIHEIPVIIREFSDVDGFEAAIIENVQRADLDPLEEAQGYRRLMTEYGHTQEMIAAATGKSRSHIGNLLRLLDLPAAVQALLGEGRLTVGHAKAVLQARDGEELARQIVERGLNVRQAEELARKSHEAPKPARQAPAASLDADLALIEDQLREALGVAVTIRARGHQGTVSLAYSDLDQLDAIIARLQG